MVVYPPLFIFVNLIVLLSDYKYVNEWVANESEISGIVNSLRLKFISRNTTCNHVLGLNHQKYILFFNRIYKNAKEWTWIKGPDSHLCSML